MKTVKSACELQPKALEINVGDQIEQLDQIIQETNGEEYFKKTFITDGMKMLILKGMARLAGKTNDTVFHLKQAMGGGKTHLMVGFGLLAQDAKLRQTQIGTMPYQGDFTTAKVAAFNGRNNPPRYIWGEIARQLNNESLFKEYWESGAKAPDEQAWLQLFEGDEPILILLDEMPPYFQYYSTQTLGQGTVADVITRAFSNMLTAAQKKKNVCIVVSDLEAAYDTGGKLIQTALDDAKQELGRSEVSITPVNLESNEIYEILRKRLFRTLPSSSEIAEIASVYATRLAEAAKAKTVERSAEALASEIESTYPFHPSFKSIVALFKENEKFKQTRGLMELVSRLLKSVWENNEDVYLIGAQHFDLSIHEVREKLADISDMRDVIAKDLWDSAYSAHAQVIDLNNGNNYAKQAGTLLLLASLSTAVQSVKGLNESEMLECLIDPIHQASVYKAAFTELQKAAWYLHQTQEGRNYFSRQENLTKKLQGYAEKAPENRVEDLIRKQLEDMYQPKTKEAYEKVLALPSIDEAHAIVKTTRTLLIVKPDGKTTPGWVAKFFNEQINKNYVLVLTGNKTSMASVDKAARHMYAIKKADSEIPTTHPQRQELEDKISKYEQDFHITVLSVFDKLLFPGNQQGQDTLRSKTLDTTYTSNTRYDGEQQVIKTLTSDPIKLYTDIPSNFDALRARAESLLFGNQEEVRKTDLIDRMKQKTQMPWLPTRGLDQLIVEACQRGIWEDLRNSYITKKPKPKMTEVIVTKETDPDDSGNVRLKIDVLNAGKNPRIHYAEDGEVSEQSPVLKDNTLVTNALNVQFLAIDPTGENTTGVPTTFKNNLVIRNYFNEVSRTVELFVAPRGTIKYTLDGSEARNGIEYTAPIQLTKEEATIYVFAECDGFEEKRNFTFSKSGSTEVPITKNIPATLIAQRPKRLENSVKVYEGLSLAKEKSIEFEQVMLTIGSTPQIIHVTFGEIKLNAVFIESELNRLKELVGVEAQVLLTFKKLYTKTGYDLEQFTNQLCIEIESGEVEQ